MELQASTTTPTADSKPRAHLTALAAAMRELGFAVASVPPQRALLYRFRAGPVGTVVLRTYSAPQPGWPRPLVWRWHIDHLTVRASRRALTELGLTPLRGSRHERWSAPSYGLRKLELSCLPCELAPLARWLPKWLEARELGMTHPPCPVRLSREGEEVRGYGWSAAAEQAMSEWTSAEYERRSRRTLALAEAAAVRRATGVAERGDATIQA